MIVTEVRPATLDRQDVATEAGRAWLTERYARTDDAYVRLNMITSLTGAASGSDGTSDTLTSRTDRTILGVIRAAADVVVVGRAERARRGLRRPAQHPARDRHRVGRPRGPPAHARLRAPRPIAC